MYYNKSLQKAFRLSSLLGAVLLLAVLTLTVTMGTASASDGKDNKGPSTQRITTLAVTCSGTNCNGKDPIATHCADGSYVALSAPFGTTAFGGVVELKWSPTCKTNWAKAYITSSNPPNATYTLTVMLQRPDWSEIPGTKFTLGNTRSIYGDMYYAPTEKVRACAGSVEYATEWQCTAAG